MRRCITNPYSSQHVVGNTWAHFTDEMPASSRGHHLLPVCSINWVVWEAVQVHPWERRKPGNVAPALRAEGKRGGQAAMWLVTWEQEEPCMWKKNKALFAGEWRYLQLLKAHSVARDLGFVSLLWGPYSLKQKYRPLARKGILVCPGCDVQVWFRYESVKLSTL